MLLGLTSVVGSTGSHHPHSTGLPVQANRTRLLELRKQALRQCAAGSFQKAADIYRQGYQLALASHDLGAATHFLSNLGGTYLLMFDYQDAMKALIESRKLAEKLPDKDFVGIIAFNLASLYWHLGDIEAADQAAQRGMRAVGDSELRGFRPLLLITLARIRGDQDQFPEAINLLHQAVASASIAGDVSALASAWDCLGEVLLDSGDIAAAERPLAEGLRLRLLSNDRDLRVSYLKLSRLRLEQHDTNSASVLFDRALMLPMTDAGMPVWSIYWLKGKILIAQHRPTEALAWFEKAVKAWQIWRDNMARADEVRAHSDSYSRRILRANPKAMTSSLVDTNLALQPSPNIEALVALEECRAITVQQTLTESAAWRKRMPPEYWQTLQHLHSVQASQLTKDTPEARYQIAHYQQELTELEVRAGLPPSRPIRNKSFEKVDASVTLRGIELALKPEEALFSFYLGEAVSGVWAVTDNSIEFHRLPPGNVLAVRAREFELAVRHSSRERDRLGEELYRQLFHDVSQKVERKPVWLIGSADELFDIPMAALVTETKDGKPVYLVERHATERIPSALMLGNGAAQATDGPFLGMADGLYNTADPRWRSMKSTANFLGISFPQPKPAAPFELPRLAGSTQEIQACARIWQGSSPAVLLTGGGSTRAGFESGLHAHPAIIHIAAHVIAQPDKPNQALIDFGLSPGGQPEVLTYEDIANLEVPGSTVVVDGCASASAGAKFGGGVMGLTRAWLMAGAQTVVGTRWPIPDDTGELFQSFYANWKANRGSVPSKRIVADSLQRAQLSIMHSHTWRSDPKYWSAFYVFGKE